MDGIITQLDVSQGQRVQADATSMLIAAEQQLIVRLGIEPEDLENVQAGTPVTITSVFIPDVTIATRIREVHAMIDPATHLVEVLAPIPQAQIDHLILGSRILGRIQLASRRALVVPRSAVLWDSGQAYVYIVDAGKARRMQVKPGMDNGDRIEIDPEKLAAYGLTFSDVATAVSASNVLQAVGRLEDHYKLYLLLSDTRIRSLKTIEETVLRSGSNGLVRLDDIARIYPTMAPQWLRVTADGHDAVLVQVYQQPGGNTVKIVDGVKQRLDSYHDKLPKGVSIANWYDQSQLISESATSVRDAIAIGVGLAAVVLLVFLRSVKITLVAILIVPAVLATTILLLNVLHMSFNIMTLGGMAAAVGLIIDDAIVMIEHIIRRLRQRSQAITLTIREAAIEFTPPLIGSSAATIVIFAPLTFLSGVTGAFFKALSLTMASSLFISFLLAWLAVPLLAEHLLNKKDAEKEDVGVLFNRLLETYQRLMQRLMKTPWLILLGIVPLLVVGSIAYKQVGSGFMLHMDEGGFILD